MLDTELIRERNHLESIIGQCFDRLDELTDCTDTLLQARTRDLWRAIQAADMRVREIEQSLPPSALQRV